MDYGKLAMVNNVLIFPGIFRGALNKEVAKAVAAAVAKAARVSGAAAL